MKWNEIVYFCSVCRLCLLVYLLSLLILFLIPLVVRFIAHYLSGDHLFGL